MSEKLSEAIVDFANALAVACVQLKSYIGQQHGVGVKEETFTRLVAWEKSQGFRLGEFEFTTRRANNNSDAFNHAYTILKANSASIGSRFHNEGYRFGYWIYREKPDVIYRQTLKK